MIVIDTNILLHSVNEDSPFHKRCADYLEHSINSIELGLTWPIVYEFLRVSTHPNIFPNPLSGEDAWALIYPIIDRTNVFLLQETDIHVQTFLECAAETFKIRGNIFHDFHTSVLMREHGVKKIATFDTDFKAFQWVEVVKL